MERIDLGDSNNKKMRYNIKFIWYLSLEIIYLKCRRWFYYHFKRKKMMESIAKRKGCCNYEKCGKICCGYYLCDYFNFNNSKCKINENKPISCKLFPFDEKDKSRRVKFICSLYWD